MKKSVLVLLAALLFLNFIPDSVRADGFTIYTDRSHFALHDETTQVAAISYENGREKLLLSVKLDQLTEDSVVWIVPVPAEAAEVRINIIEEFPEFWGNDILLLAEESVESVRSMALLMGFTQVWTYPFLAPLLMFGIGGMLPPGVEVHAHVEKDGIVTEVVTAETATALNQYLESKNVGIPAGSIPILDDYIGRNYSFVTSWIKSMPAGDTDVAPAIFVEFPADRIFYPLKPTSVYGKKEIPVLLYVMGYVEPVIYPEIESFTEYSYFRGGVRGPEEFYLSNGDSKDIYTRIMIGSTEDWVPALPTPPAEFMVDDLWMTKLDQPPQEVQEALAIISRARSLDDNWPVIFLLWLVGLSLVSGALAGSIIFRKAGKFALIGLANCFTLVGLIVATVTLAGKEEGRKEKGNRLWFIGLFSVFFLAINFIIVYPILRYFLFT